VAEETREERTNRDGMLIVASFSEELKNRPKKDRGATSRNWVRK